MTNQGKGPQQAQFLQQDLKKVGITANIKEFDPATYYSSVVGVPANIKKDGYGLAFAGWGPDWPAPYGFFENIVDPRKILPQGNSNYGACSDPHITSLINRRSSRPARLLSTRTGSRSTRPSSRTRVMHRSPTTRPSTSSAAG